MATQAPQQRGSIVDAKDLRVVVRIVSRNWYFVAVALVLASVLSYLYSYKLPIVYGASTQVLLRERDTYSYQSEVYKNIGYIGVYGDLANQKRVLTSHDLLNTTLDKLDFDVSYFNVGRFKTSQVYGTVPFTVKIDLLNPRLYEKPIDLKVLGIDRYELSYDKGGGVVKKRFHFGRESRTEDFLIKVTLSPYISEASVVNIMPTDYQFVRHDRKNLVRRFKSRIQVANHDYTTILQITVEDEVADRAKVFLDTLSRVYIDYSLQSEFDINRNTLVFIDRQLDEVSAILENYEDEIQEYKESKEIIKLGKEENIYFGELLKYDQQRRGRELEIRAMDSLVDYLLHSTDSRLLPARHIISSDGYVQNLLGHIQELQIKRNSMLYTGTESNPSLAQLDYTLGLTKGDLLAYIRNARQSVLDKIDYIDEQIADFEGLIRSLPKSRRDIMKINRQLQVNEKMYLFLLEKRANTVIARASIVPQSRVIENARSIGVVRPDKLKIFYTFMLGGIVASMLVVFVRIMFYDRIENAEQLKEQTTMPVYGEIILSEKAEENYVVVDSDPKAAITECFRSVRTNLEYVPGEEGKGKVVMVTSYRPNEGKTFCSVNLSAILSKAGKKVLLLELDLHKPKVSLGLGMSSPVGISTVLVGKVDWREVVQPTRFENFDVILSGPTPPNASELVLSRHLERLFTEAKESYDYVLVDTPPVGLITDALLMMRFADTTLFVVNTRFANKDHVTNAVEVLQASAGKNSGFILNGVRMKKSKYYYNTNYGYGYRYAYGYGSGYGYGYGYGRKSKRGRKAEAPENDTRA